MKLMSYRHDGTTRAGLLRDGVVVDLGASMLDVLVAEAFEPAPGAREHPVDAVELLPPVRPPKLLACAGNYQEHLAEGGAKPLDKSRAIPRLFIKPASTLLAPGAPLRLPSLSHEVDWELELAVVLGAGGRIAGYTILNDVSARSLDWEVEREPSDWNGFFDWLNGKWFDGFAPMGPCIVTADAIRDPQSLALELRLNGEVRQSATTAAMIFGVEELVEFAARLVTLEPGDVIATGTPAGVGHATRRFLQPGDVMEGEIERIGLLRTPVAGG